MKYLLNTLAIILLASCSAIDTSRIAPGYGAAFNSIKLAIFGDNNEIDKKVIKSQKPSLSGKADNILLTTNFTLKNFKKVFYENDFLDLLLTTFYFTFFGTIGAIFFGILAAQLVNQNFYGRSFMRSILLFPYVGPVVALAYTWTCLLYTSPSPRDS